MVSDRSDRLLHRLYKQIIIVKQLLSSCNIDMVNKEMANLDQMFFDYLDVNTRILELAPGIPDAENCIATIDEMIFELKKDVATWLSDAEEKISRRSRASSRSSSTSSRKSIASSGAASRKSVKSNNSDASMCSIQNKAHMAGLMAEKNGVKDRFGAELEKEIELLKQRKDAEMQSKLLELENEITVSKAKQAIFDNNDDTFVNVTRRKGNFQQREPIGEKCIAGSLSKERIEREDECRYEHKNTGNEMESLCSVMIQMLKSQAAPDVDIDNFDGTMVEYPTFRTSFKEAVESPVDDQRGRLNKLIKYTIGEPKELVSGFILDNTGCCYDNAIQALYKEYGDNSHCICIHEGITTVAFNSKFGCQRLQTNASFFIEMQGYATGGTFDGVGFCRKYPNDSVKVSNLHSGSMEQKCTFDSGNARESSKFL